MVPLHGVISVIKCQIVLESWFRVKVLARFQHLSPLISLCMSPSTGCVFGRCTPSLSVHSLPTPLILDAICNSFRRLSYLRGASQACPVPALLSVYHKCTSVKNKLSSIDLPSCCLRNVRLFASCNSAHGTLLCCSSLYGTVLCLLYICMWAVMNAIVLHCIGECFTYKTPRKLTWPCCTAETKIHLTQIAWIYTAFIPPNAA